MLVSPILGAGDTSVDSFPVTPRTYQVRTYGCQMNVHDSERLI